jgi:hypothetical protein
MLVDQFACAHVLLPCPAVLSTLGVVEAWLQNRSRDVNIDKEDGLPALQSLG